MRRWRRAAVAAAATAATTGPVWHSCPYGRDSRGTRRVAIHLRLGGDPNPAAFHRRWGAPQPPPPTRPGASNDWTAIEAGGPASKDWGGTDGVAGSDMDSCSASAALAEGGVEDATAAAIPATASAPSPCTPTAGVSGGSAASGRTPPLAPSGSPTSCAAGEYE